ncbi:MAG: phospholipase D family protein [Desulfobacteraceae bacterium]|nr:phospholipase D family protein [Desulfobacteraceae bacterium]
MHRRHFYIAMALAAVLLSCATIPTGFERPVSQALTDTDNTALGQNVSAQKAAHPGQSGFHLLSNGLDAFVARAVLAHGAERSLDVQYYLYHDDLVGHLFTDLLIKAADRGVRVRLLVDDMDLAGRDMGAAALDRHPNIEVRIFNPFSREAGRTSQFVTRMGSVTRRMHNKSFTADNQITILGGRNIGNEYFDADPDLSFADLDVMCIGPVAQEVSSVFDRYWNSELAYPVSVLYKGEPLSDESANELRRELAQFVAQQESSNYIQALKNSTLANDLRKKQLPMNWGEGRIVFDQPEKVLHDFEETQFHLSPMLKPYWEGIQKELVIFSPYFVPGKEGTAFLTGLARRGVRVKILTNSLASNDVGLVHSGYQKYRKDLLRGGVELYELNKTLTREERKEKKGHGGSSKASLHAKSFVFDRKQVFIGSLNLDPRSVLQNTEIGVVLTVPAIAEKMAEGFDENINKGAFRLELKKDENGVEQLLWHGYENGQPTVFTHEPHTGFWRRFGIGFMSIWPIESQL